MKKLFHRAQGRMRGHWTNFVDPVCIAHPLLALVVNRFKGNLRETEVYLRGSGVVLTTSSLFTESQSPHQLPDLYALDDPLGDDEGEDAEYLDEEVDQDPIISEWRPNLSAELPWIYGQIDIQVSQ